MPIIVQWYGIHDNVQNTLLPLVDTLIVTELAQLIKSLFVSDKFTNQTRI